MSKMSLIRRAAMCALLMGGSLAGINASAATLNIRVDGLPRGLSVAAVGGFVTCGLNSVSFNFGTLGTLQENSYTTFEQVTLPFGGFTFVTVTHYFYTGTFSVGVPGNSNCNADIPADTYGYFYSIAGSGTVRPFRDSRTFNRRVSGTVSVSDTFTAKTDSIQSRLVFGDPFTTLDSLRVGIEKKVLIKYSDTMNGDSIQNPTIELMRQVTVNGLVTQAIIAKATVRPDKQVCVTAGSVSQCGRLGSGGLLTAGGLTVDASDVLDSVIGTGRSITWPIKIDDRYLTGTISVAARANDFDPITYLVYDEPTDLDLLPWKTLRVPVTITN